MISYYRHRANPKRKKAMSATITGPRTVSAQHPSRIRKTRPERPDDSEAEQRAMDFIKGMLKPV
jgi:hypothetical protein